MRKIIHIDMDCFYAAVEEKHNPSLKGKPVGVGGPPNSRSVLCTANYEARKFGVKAAVPSSRAVRLCPDLILVPPNFKLYKEESRAVRKIFEDYTDAIEPLSLDEAFLDVTHSTQKQNSATLIAKEIKSRIQTELKLTASAGVSCNKFLAKIASDINKPNGIFVVRPQDIDAFMPQLKVEKIYGVGKVTARKLHQLKLFTCGDIQKLSLLELKRLFGNRAKDYFDLCRGIDHRQVCSNQETKSISVEETFNQDLRDMPQLTTHLPGLYRDFLTRVSRRDYVSRIHNFHIKLKFSDFTATTCQQGIKRIPNVEEFETLFRRGWARKAMSIRLAGIGVGLAVPESEHSSANLELDV